MRVYVHYEEDILGPVHTKKITIKDPNALASEVLSEFVASFNEAHGSGKMSMSEMGLATQPKTKRLIALTEPLSGVLKDKGECFVVSTGVKSAPSVKTAMPQQTPNPSSIKNTTTVATRKRETTNSSAAATTAANIDSSSSSSPSAVAKAADKAAALAAALTAQGLLRQAREAYERIVGKGSQEGGALPHVPSLTALGDLAANQGRHDQAARYFNKAVEAAVAKGGEAGSGGGSGSEQPVVYQLCGALLGMGKASQSLGEVAGAVQCFQRALKLLLSSGSGGSGSDGGGKQGGKQGGNDLKLLEVDVKVALAGALLSAGRPQEAADLVTSALAPPEFGDHAEGLVMYATIAEQFGKDEEALSVLLRVAVTHQGHKPAKALLAKIVAKTAPPLSPAAGEEGGRLLLKLVGGEAGVYGLDLLRGMVPLTEASVSAFAFLATVCKDCGEVEASCGLLQLASTQAPHSHSYALNLMHAHETRNDNERAYSCLRDHLAALSTLPPASTSLSACASAVLALLANYPTLKSAVTAAAVAAAPTTAENKATLKPPPPPPPRFHVQWFEGGGKGNGGNAVKLKGCDSSAQPYAEFTPVPSKEGQADPGEPRQQPLPLVEYDEASLDLIALLMAGVKVCYLSGALALAVSFASLVEPHRVASKTFLHTTTIRNEHAYYCCALQCLASRTTNKADPSSSSPPSSSISAEEAAAAAVVLGSGIVGGGALGGSGVNSGGTAVTVIHVVGDSHVLSPAWKAFPLTTDEPTNQRVAVLKPELTTGCKHWHLRDECTFYPKRNFERVTVSIPNEATVLFVLGEIDCREGLLVAVEKDRYPDLETGMRATMAHFLTTLASLVEAKRWRVLVHPIVPVLDETRPVVIAYNALLREQVNALGEALRAKKQKQQQQQLSSITAEASTTAGAGEGGGGGQGGSVAWLEGVFEELLVNSKGGGLKPEYHLDGTHLHPMYVENLLVPAVVKALEPNYF